ncbi:hypothetical protein WN48_04793 [Eufriesea mexicana]|uniref:Receptor ligand binding region domain-containing protein n=1 Tax=Eufriesea mexicana TaxID=516756 RepID=A0A310S9Y1_9HYME|nr:hypothetical protein WN48_04793 [Eufriesea mexicana]
MEFLNWTKVAIIYEDDYALVAKNGIMKFIGNEKASGDVSVLTTKKAPRGTANSV